jgi:hypothetical protein
VRSRPWLHCQVTSGQARHPFRANGTTRTARVAPSSAISERVVGVQSLEVGATDLQQTPGRVPLAWTAIMSTGIVAADIHQALVAAKTSTPRIHPGIIRRERLTNRLAASADLPLVVVSAPVGYGKTTLLVDWLQHDDRTVAWVSLDRDDDDVATLMTTIIAGVKRVRELDPSLSQELVSPDVSVLGRVVPGLAASIGAVDEPLVVVLDHLDEIRSLDCQDALRLLLDLLPEQVQLVVSSRREVWLAGGRRRVRGEVLEIGATDLVFDETETEELLAGAGVRTRQVGTVVLARLGDAEALFLLLRGGLAGQAEGHHRSQRGGNDQTVIHDSLLLD